MAERGYAVAVLVCGVVVDHVAAAVYDVEPDSTVAAGRIALQLIEITAAEVEAVEAVEAVAEVVESIPDYQGIDQGKLVPLLVASLQEALARISALEA